jgi:hypothetical protein
MKNSAEKIVFSSMRISMVLALILMLILTLMGLSRTHWFTKTAIGLIAVFIFLVGLWTILGSIYRWRTFKKAYRSIDFELFWGGLGSFLYVFLGLLAIGVAGFIFYKLFFHWTHG